MSANQQILMVIAAENKAGQTLQQVKQQVSQTGQQIEQANARAAQSIQKVQANYLQATAGFAAVSASATSLATSFSVLDKAQTAVVAQQTSLARASDTLQRSQTALDQANLRLQKSQERLTALRESGKASAQELALAEEQVRINSQKVADAQQKLSTDHMNVEAITLRLRDAQNNLSDTYANFAAGLAPQIISISFGITSAFKALGITSVTQLIPAIRGVGLAMKAAFLSPPPIGLVIAGVATVVALLVTNFGGFRDAIIELGNRIFAFIQQHLRPLADLLSWLNDNVIQPVAKALGLTTVQSLEETMDAVDEFKQETIDLGRAIAATQKQIEQTTVALDPGLTQASEQVEEALTGVEAVAQRNIEKFGAIGRTALKTGEEMQQATDAMVSGLDAVEQRASNVRSALERVNESIERTRIERDELARGRIEGFREAEDRHARDIADQIGAQFQRFGTPKHLQDQFLSSAISIAGLSPVQEPAAILTDVGFQNALNQMIQQNAAFEATQSLAARGLLEPIAQALGVGIRSGVTGNGMVKLLDISIKDLAERQDFQLDLIDLANRATHDNISELLKEMGFNVFTAQSGLRTRLTRDSVIFAHANEDVNIRPKNASVSGGSLKLVLAVDGRELAEVMLDDIDELLTTRTVPRKLKVRGVRLQ